MDGAGSEHSEGVHGFTAWHTGRSGRPRYTRRLVSSRSLVLVAVLLASCAEGSVPLSYQVEPGRRLEHRLVLTADITRTLAGDRQDQTVVAAFRAVQETLPPAEVGASQATVSLVPESLEVDGRAVEAGPPQVFTVTLGKDGRVVAVEESAAAGEPLQPVGLERLLPRLRPVLPGRPVSPGEAWRSRTRFQDEQGRFSVDATSRLAQLGVTQGFESALVRTTYRSPVAREETFANAVADIVGRDVGAQEAWFALDGFLVRSSTDSVGTYQVTFRPPGGEPGVAPVAGSLVVRLHTEMELVSAG
jgi:hypothetical protein